MPEVRDRNVYILGAGFSAPTGVPVIHDFIDRARHYFDDPSSNMDDSERDHFKRFLEFKREMSQAREKVKIDLDNIEDLFGLVEISQRLGRTRLQTRSSTVYVIAKTIELSARSQRIPTIGFQAESTAFQRIGEAPPPTFRWDPSFGQDYGRFMVDLYDFFAALCSGLLDMPEKRAARSNSFITFNYDLVLDDALRRVGLVPNYHLPEKRILEGREMGITPSCSVLKLHGSTNWGVCGSCKKVAIVTDEKVTISHTVLDVKECPKCHTTGFQPLLIPPSWDKSEYREIMQPVWARAVLEMAQASRICIIGYSMPEADSFFRYLLALALSQNHNLYSLIIVDKNPNIESKYKKILEPLFRRRRLIPYWDNSGGFSSFLSNDSSIRDLGRGEELVSRLQLF